MKTTVVIENGKVTIQVNDGEPVPVPDGRETAQIVMPVSKSTVAVLKKQRDQKDESEPVAGCRYCRREGRRCRYHETPPTGHSGDTDVSVGISQPEKVSELLPTPLKTPMNPAPAHKEKKSRKVPDPDNCGWCKRKGSPCVKHGGTATAKSPSKRTEQGDNYALVNAPEKPVDYNATGELAPEPTFADFDDQWNCAMCRNAQGFCVLHERMNAEGKQPPRNVRSL